MTKDTKKEKSLRIGSLVSTRGKNPEYGEIIDAIPRKNGDKFPSWIVRFSRDGTAYKKEVMKSQQLKQYNKEKDSNAATTKLPVVASKIRVERKKAQSSLAGNCATITLDGDGNNGLNSQGNGNILESEVEHGEGGDSVL